MELQTCEILISTQPTNQTRPQCIFSYEPEISTEAYTKTMVARAAKQWSLYVLKYEPPKNQDFTGFSETCTKTEAMKSTATRITENTNR